MRDSLRSLTPRGRVLVAGGLTVLVCAILLSEPLLLAFGLLGIGLPLLAVVVMAFSRTDLTLSRHLTPAMVPVGVSATVHLRIGNPGPSPRGHLMLEDTLPFALGSRPRFVLTGLSRGWRREVTYQVRSDVRGRHELGPMTVRSADPLGLVEIPRSFRVITPLLVTPRPLALPALALNGRRDLSGDRRLRASSAGHAEDLTVREYRMGDDLRRVHWRSSARTGELMVRREEQHSQTRAVVFLDTRSAAHAGQGAASSWEAAVTIAASVAAHFVHRGWSTRLLTSAGHDVSASGVSELPAILAALAAMEASAETTLDVSLAASVRSGDLVLAVLGATTAADDALLTRLARVASPALALQTDVRSWGALDSAGPTPPAGWHWAPVARDTALASAWRDLARSGTAAGTAAGTGGVR